MPSPVDKIDREFIGKMMAAAKNLDPKTFAQLLAQKKSSQKLSAIVALLQAEDIEGNNIFHHLLSKDSNYFSRRKTRRLQAQMCYLLLEEKDLVTTALSKRNRQGESPLSMAIRNGYEGYVDKMLAAGCDITTLDSENRSLLELAVSSGRFSLYKKLLEIHCEQNLESTLPTGFTCQQLERAKQLYVAQLQSKQRQMGIFGTILAIACPVGAVLAFNELPLLEIVFSALIPTIGPAVGLVGAMVVGGLLFWSMYSKSAKKYGSRAEELAEIDSKEAKIYRLRNELKEIDSQIMACKATDKHRYNLLSVNRRTCVDKITTLYKPAEADQKPEPVAPRNEAKLSDWATSQDRFRSRMLTTGSFICSFSGVLGLLGFLSSYVNVAVGATALVAGVPVVGWLALGVAITVGLGVAAWAYNSKYKPALTECGRAQQELHNRKLKLYESGKAFELEHSKNGLGMPSLNQRLSWDSNDSKTASMQYPQHIAQSDEKGGSYQFEKVLGGMPARKQRQAVLVPVQHEIQTVDERPRVRS